jgi:hypothetical protein
MQLRPTPKSVRDFASKAVTGGWRHRRDKGGAFSTVLALAMLGMVGTIGFQAARYAASPSKDIEVTVLGKEIMVENKSSTWLIHTDKGTLQNEDSFTRLKWNSADLQNFLQPGQTYTLRTHGFRSPLFSMFPNVDCVVSDAKVSAASDQKVSPEIRAGVMCSP